MKFLHLSILVLIALLLTACPLENERPPKQINPVRLPELPESIIQVPLVLKSRELKRAFYDAFPNPLLKGATKEMKLKLSGKEKKKEDKNFFNKLTDPLLGWLDKTFQVSSHLLYEIDLYSFDFWFEGDKFYADIMLDLRTKIVLNNGLSFLGKNVKLDGTLDCPMQVRMVLDGTIGFDSNAELKVAINDDNAKIKFQKICSSKAFKQIDMPKVIKPVLLPLKNKIVKSINKLLAKQLQKLLDLNSNHLSFRDKVDLVAQKLGESYGVMDEVWLLPNVHEIFVSPINGTGKGVENQLEIDIGAKARPSILMTDKKPKTAYVQSLNFAVNKYSPGTTISVRGAVSLKQAEVQLQSILKKYIDENHSKHGYTIGPIVIYPSDNRVVVAIDVLKTKNLKKKATLYLWGIPRYDNIKQEIYLDELAFTAKSKNIILKFAQWIMNPKIMKQLELNTRFEISDQLKEIKKQLNSFELEEEGAKLTGNFNYVNVSEVFVTETNFEVFLQAKGNLNLELNWKKE